MTGRIFVLLGALFLVSLSPWALAAPIPEEEGSVESTEVEPKAETAEESKIRASGLLNEGNELLLGGAYEGALAKYQAAYEAFPSPKILLNIAQAHKQMGHAAEALRHYEAFLEKTTPEAVGEKLRKAASEEAGKLRRLVGRIEVTSNVVGAQVTIDGAAKGEAPVTDVIVDPGRHEIEVTAPEHDPFKEAFVVAADETKTVMVTLRPTGTEEVIPPPPPPPPKDDSVFEKWWFWAAVGTVTVGVTTAVAVSTGGDDFVPQGELGSYKISDWNRF